MESKLGKQIRERMRDRKIGNNFNRSSWLKYPSKFGKLLKLGYQKGII